MAALEIAEGSRKPAQLRIELVQANGGRQS
jgi:hypothetical protein